MTTTLLYSSTREGRIQKSSRSSLVLLVAALLSAGSVSRAGLIAYWNFDEGSGVTAADTSGVVAPHNGTLSANAPDWIPGRLGSALKFVRADNGNLVTVPNHPDLLLNGPFTISFWYRPDAVVAASTFPGIVRIGSQGDTGSNVGWGFFRASSQRIRFKRFNVQPDVWNPPLDVGKWYHIALRWDGASGNIGYINGTPISITGNWGTANTTANLEFGRMDQFDDASLDDFALFNEQVDQGKIRSLYTVPTAFGLDYNLADLRAMWAIFDAGPGASGEVKSTVWSYTASLPGSTTPGDAYLSGGQWYVVLGSGAGLTANAFIVGNFSPAGIGAAGTVSFDTAPAIVSEATLVFDLGSATTPGGGINDLIEIQGDLTITNNTIEINPLAPLAAGTYRLITYTGAKNGSFNPVVAHHTRYTLTLDDTTAGEINLVVSGSNAALTWASAASGVWDLSLSNWLNTATTEADAFAQGDTVRFDDSGAFQTNVTFNTVLYPASITVDSSGLNYSFTGSGSLSGLGDGLTKNGSSFMTLAGGNNFVGPVSVNAGTLKVGSALALGSTNAGTTIASGATLDVNNQTPGYEPVSVSGDGVGGAGAIVNTASGSTADALRRVTLTDDTTFGGSGRWDLTGTLAGNGHKLTKVGANEIWIAPFDGDTGLGDIEIRQGTLGFEGVGFPALGDPSAMLTIQSNAALGFWALNNATNPMLKTVVMNSGIWRNNSGNNHFNGTVTLNGSNVFTVASGHTLNQLGTIQGEGDLNKNDSGTLVLTGNDTYSGETRVNAGTLTLLDEGSISGSAVVTVASGAALRASTRTDGTLTLAADQSLGGNGTVQGSVVAGPGTGLAPGSGSTGTLTITNGLSLPGGATMTYQLASDTTEGGGVNDLVNVGGDLTLAGTTTLNIIPVGDLNLVSPYTLLTYGGSLTGDAANFNVATESRTSFTVDTTTTPGKVQLFVTGGAPLSLTWAGGSAGAPMAWDVRTTPNWTGLTPGEVFYAGDTVTFNDTATVFDVDLVEDVSPAHSTVDAATHDYTFTGSGGLRGGGLTKTSGGTLTIANSGVNDYPGPTIIEAGTVQVGAGGAAGSLGPGPLTNNATLIFDRSVDFTLANVVSGTGSLVKRNTNLVNLADSMAGFAGPITVQGGTIRPLTANGLGTTAAGVTIGSGGTLDVNGLNLGTEAVSVQGPGANGVGAIINTGAAQQNALQNIILTGDTAIGGVNRWDLRAAPSTFEGNNFNLTKVGANQIWLVDAGETELINIAITGGTLGIQGTTTVGDQFGELTVEPGATLGLYALNTNVLRKTAFLNDAIINNGNGANTFSGDMQLTGSNAIVVASGTSLTLTDPITGTGSLNVQGGGGTVNLLADNTYLGGTTIAAGGNVLELGNGGTTGSVMGDIVDDSLLSFNRSDEVILANNITGAGAWYIRMGGGLILDGTKTVQLSGNIEVGRNVPGKLIFRNGAVMDVGRINVGNVANTVGEVVQEDGNVTVSTDVRVGHWPNEHSTYLMGGGTLTLTGLPTGVVNPPGQPEQNGILYIGVDGTGTFTQTGGVVSAHGIVFDGRGSTGGQDIFNLEGGRFVLGPSGLKSGNLDQNPNYQINLGGGTIASSANWTSVLNMTLTGTNGNVTFDTAGYTNVLFGNLTGIAQQSPPGGLIKTGAGALALVGTNTYEGNTTVDDGILAVVGSLGAAFGEVRVTGGVLAGTGTVNVHTFIESGGTLAPGLSIGTLTMINDLSLAGATVMEIDKAGTALSNDHVVANGLTYGGTLTVVATGDPLTAGDTFDLFDWATLSGAFTAPINLPSLPAGLAWDTSGLPVDGTLRVVAGGGPAIKFSLAGSRFELSWDPAATGFTLQSQTNALGQGINTAPDAWADVLTGIENHTYVVDPVPTDANVFYRLIQQPQ